MMRDHLTELTDFSHLHVAALMMYLYDPLIPWKDHNHNPLCFQCSTNWPFSQCDFGAEFPEISEIAL